MDQGDYARIRGLLDEYLRMYASRDDGLTARFSDDFSGFTGGGDFLVKSREAWVAITRQDFAQVREPITIELKDVAIQSLADTVAVATSFFTIRLPIVDHVLSRETARLVLIFRREGEDWKITHSSISIPYYLVREGEVYPMQALVERNLFLEDLVSERTSQLSAAVAKLRAANAELTREIAERRQSDEALQKSEERYRSILTASPDDITITDAAGGVIMVSPRAYQMFGLQEESQILGRPLTDFLVPEDRPRATARIASMRRGAVTGTSEYRALHADGHAFDVEVNSEFIRNAAGTPTGMVVIVRDVSDRKRAEAERRRLEALTRQLQKGESLGRMAGAVAHHFNNKLQSVIMGLEIAMSDLPGEAGALEVLGDALGAARKAAELSGSMLTYLGQRSGERAPLSLGECCRRSMPLLGALLPKHVVLSSDFPAEGPIVHANENEIQQVLASLATNAQEAMADGRCALGLAVRTVAAATIPADRRFPADFELRAPSYACLEVSDTGAGIAPENFEKLFDPFFSSKSAGRGLGLPVVLGVVRAHGGAITVESAPGRGSTFRVFLPISPGPVPSPPVSSPPVSPPPATSRPSSAGARVGGTVLLVDDEPAVLQSLSRALRRLGYAVFAAQDGFTALELFEREKGAIDCVLCDVTMPRMDGWETLAALRARAPELPFILASGYDEAQVTAGRGPQLPDAFLHKPYDAEELASAIHRAVAGAFARTSQG